MTTVARPGISLQLAAAAVGTVVLVVALSASAELGPVGWLAGSAYFVGFSALLVRAVRRAGAVTLGPAGAVTLTRAVLVGVSTALVAHGLATGRPAVPAIVVVATVALVLDAVDGRVARRTATTTALGARFDMEVDAFLLAVLSVHVATLVGPWVLAIGALRYGFVAAGWLLPWLRAELPPRYSAKFVAALQGIVLVVASAELLPRPLTGALLAAALALLTWSFGHDVRWLWRCARATETTSSDPTAQPNRTPDPEPTP